jgi:hypothetical protein
MIGAIAITVGLSAHGSLASGTSFPRATDMITMMDTDGMEAMHSAMHQAVSGTVSADVLAACDSVHNSMMSSSTPSSTIMPAGHASHHPGAQP